MLYASGALDLIALQNPDRECERQVWGIKTNSRRQG
jgi:hypothetical protein